MRRELPIVEFQPAAPEPPFAMEELPSRKAVYIIVVNPDGTQNVGIKFQDEV
jgi:hypothetical protein